MTFLSFPAGYLAPLNPASSIKWNQVTEMETVRTIAHASRLQIVLELCAPGVTLLLPLEI